jgi:peptidoglycan/LPS O-acetylase OafA/YrhL
MQHSETTTFGFFGFFRFFLASWIVVAHLTEYWYLGAQSVHIFFVLSGYVVTYILEEKYRHMPLGYLRYGINRALRIYPAYWMALTLTIVLLVHWPNLFAVMDWHCTLENPLADPYYFSAWISNVLIMGITSYVGVPTYPLILPPMWSINIELVYWCLIPVLLYYPRLRLPLLISGVLYLVVTGVLERTYPDNQIWWNMRYMGMLAGMLPFMLGHYLYYIKKRHPFRSRWLGRGLVLAYLAYFLGQNWLPFNGYMEGFYAVMLMGAGVIYYLSCVPQERFSPRMHRLNAYLGNLAYPLMICHYAAGGIAGRYLVDEMVLGWPLFFASYPVAVLLAMLVHALTEKIIRGVARGKAS